MTTIEVTDQSFAEEVLASKVPVLVDFWAEWCGPCRMVAPVLDELAGEMAGRLKVAKINIDDQPETPARLGIRSIPTMMLFRGGQPIATRTGAEPKTVLRTWLEAQLAS